MLCDLDGVVWLSHRPIPGAVEGIALLRQAGHRVLFVTNNSAALVEDQEAALDLIGVPSAGDVVTSAQAAARMVEPGERIHVCGGQGVVQAVEARGAVVVGLTELADAVVVGFHRNFDYEGLRLATRAVQLGARLIGTNDDATYPTPDGAIPGGGAILAAVATACGVEPIIAGKPHQPMADLVRSIIGDGAASQAVMVGDRPETDGLFARTLRCRYAQVWSGVTAMGTKVEPAPDLVGDHLGVVAAALVAASTAHR